MRKVQKHENFAEPDASANAGSAFQLHFSVLGPARLPFSLGASVSFASLRSHIPVHLQHFRPALFYFVLAAVGISNTGCNQSARSAYQYRVPQKTDDGWETTSIDSEAIDAPIMGALVTRIRDGSYKNVHSVLLVKNGKLVIEEYFAGRNSNGDLRHYDRDRIHEMASVTKSVTSILTGISIDQHLIRGADEQVSNLLPEYSGVFADHQRDHLRLEHLLTMTAGLSWDEWTYSYSDPRNDWVGMHNSKDAVGYILAKSVTAPPGEKFVYSGGLSFVLGEIIHRRSGMRMDQFAERHLFGPLGITNYYWSKFGDGAVEAGSGLALRPRDMAKIGYLFLNGGRWQGKQIVSEEWVTHSTTNYVDARQFPSWHADDGYGYQWWLRSFHRNGLTISSYHAAGMGGQFIFVFPGLQMVAVFTGWSENELGKQPFDMVQQYVLPAVLPPNKRMVPTGASRSGQLQVMRQRRQGPAPHAEGCAKHG